LEEFKKNLVSIKNNTQGRIKDILNEACSEVDAMFDESSDARRSAVARLGILLEQAMGNGDADFAEMEEARQKTAPGKNPAGELLKFTLSTDFDSDLLNEFIIETWNGPLWAESAILNWEQNPDNQEFLNTIFRGFHTIKGTSAFVNLDCVKDLAHQVESILAKVRRDASMRELEASLGCRIGSGYPHDQDTIDFLSQWVRENRELPPCARHSWATAQRIKASFI